MNAKKCDRCKTYYEEDNVIEGKFKMSKFVPMFKALNEIKYDLCPTCMQELDKFMQCECKVKENE